MIRLIKRRINRYLEDRYRGKADYYFESAYLLFIYNPANSVGTERAEFCYQLGVFYDLFADLFKSKG